jgi:taurine dioxygenase
MANGFDWSNLPGLNFGRALRLDASVATETHVAALERDAEALLEEFHQSRGLLVISGLNGINDDAGLLVRLSEMFGDEVEDYRQTQIDSNAIHPAAPEIYIVSNQAPVKRQPPAQLDPPLTEDGQFPTQFPHRRGWHTDQSYRRPPPDISLFYAAQTAAKGQAQTLYADGTGAYEALSVAVKSRVADLVAIHVNPGTGRGEFAVRAGETPKPLGPLAQPQHQPVVRIHPVTGKPALYLCEAGQLDWEKGPFVEMEPGPNGEGAKLLYELMTHFTQPQFVHVQDWEVGDLVVYDNRCLVHTATWYDAETFERVMWRTTVWGNPGPAYDGEARSWMPK